MSITTILKPEANETLLYCGSDLYCYTYNDDDALKLMIALEKLKLRRSLDNKACDY